jgi:DNA (cytosine-5)-methyltransferase 1
MSTVNKNAVKKRSESLKIVSLFSGAMGLDLGLEKAGFRVAVAVECNPIAVETIKLNKPKLRVILKRIENVSTSEIRKVGKLKRGDQLIVVGGPSCQAFSTAGQRRSFEDPRGTMFREFIRVVRELKPRFFVMENVRGLLSAAIKHRPLLERGPGYPQLSRNEELGSAFAKVAKELKSLGYYVSFDLLNAADYGSPQTRERLIFIGARYGERIEMPRPTHSKDAGHNLLGWVTLKEAIGDLVRRKLEYKPFHPTRRNFLSRIPAGGNWRNLPKSLQPAAIGGAYKSWGGRSGFLRRLSWDKPSPALVTVPDGNATCLCHPTRVRPLSVEEYARIQGFPDSWAFSGSAKQKYRQIGNAVPINLGKAIGQSIKRAMRAGRSKKLLGVVECKRPELLEALMKTRRTYINPPRMRKVSDQAALSTWLNSKPSRRKKMLVYAAKEDRAQLLKLL